MSGKFTYVKRGYDPEEVDKYIEVLEQTVKSYKDKDNVIKNAIISAQLAADNIVKNAHLQVNESRAQSLSQIHSILNSIGKQREKIQEFQADYNRILQKYVIQLNDLDIHQLQNKIDELEQFITKVTYISPPDMDEPPAEAEEQQEG